MTPRQSNPAPNCPSSQVSSLVAAGQRSLREGNIHQGIARLREAVDHAPTSATALHELGRGLLILGELPQATECFTRALKEDPAVPGLALNYARSKKFSIEDTQDIDLLGKALGGGGLDDRLVADLHFALGKIHDDIGRFDAAYRHYDMANRLMRSSVSFDNAKAHKAVKSLTEVFTTRYFSSLPAERSIDSRPIFIVGMPRSGTTLVEQILSAHPRVTAGDELPFVQTLSIELGRTLGSTYPNAMRRMTQRLAIEFAERYLERVESRLGACEVFTDKMPTNFFHLGLIATLFPNATLIHCQRNPLDVSLSNYFQQFEEGNDWAYELENIVKFYKHYARLMNHWRQVLPISLLEVDYETLIGNQEAACRELLEHCGLDWANECLEFFDATRTVTTSSNWQVRQPIYSSSLGRWQHYRAHIETLIDGLGNT